MPNEGRPSAVCAKSINYNVLMSLLDISPVLEGDPPTIDGHAGVCVGTSTTTTTGGAEDALLATRRRTPVPVLSEAQGRSVETGMGIELICAGFGNILNILL